MAGIFNSAIFNNAIFNTGTVAPVDEEVIKTGTGGIDPGRRGRSIVKPTGMRGTLHLPKKSPTPTERIEDSRALQAEVAAKLATEFAADNAARAREIVVPIVTMPLADIEAEIAMLLRKKLRTEEEEIMLLLLMVSAFA